MCFLFFFTRSVIHCRPFLAVDTANCPTEYTDFSGPIQLIMWKKMMHVLHTSELMSQHFLNRLSACLTKL